LFRKSSKRCRRKSCPQSTRWMPRRSQIAAALCLISTWTSRTAKTSISMKSTLTSTIPSVGARTCSSTGVARPRIALSREMTLIRVSVKTPPRGVCVCVCVCVCLSVCAYVCVCVCVSHYSLNSIRHPDLIRMAKGAHTYGQRRAYVWPRERIRMAKGEHTYGQASAYVWPRV
jgi:hypothetical protein